MLRILLYLLAIALPLFSLSSEEEPSPLKSYGYSIVVGDRVNVRENESINSKITDSLCASQEVKILKTGKSATINRVTSNWLQIEYNTDPGTNIQKKGYIFGAYVKHPSEFTEKTRVKPFVDRDCIGDYCPILIYKSQNEIFSGDINCYQDGCPEKLLNMCTTQLIFENDNLQRCIKTYNLKQEKPQKIYEFGRLRIFVQSGRVIQSFFWFDNRWISSFSYKMNYCH